MVETPGRTRKTRLKWVAAAAIVVAAVVVVIWWQGRSDEGRIRHLLHESCDAVAEKSVRGVVSGLTDDFQLEGIGGVDRIRPWLLVLFRQTGDIDARINRMTIEVDPDGQTATAWVIVSGRATGGSIDTGGWTEERTELRLAKVGGRWKVAEALVPGLDRLRRELRIEDLEGIF